MPENLTLLHVIIKGADQSVHLGSSPAAYADGNISYCRSRGWELIPAWSHTFVEIDHELFSTAILLLSADSRRAVVSYK